MEQNDTRRARTRAFLVDWLIWAYIPAASVYFFREDLEDFQYNWALYLGAVVLGAVLAFVMEHLGTSIGERTNGLTDKGDDVKTSSTPQRVPWYKTQVAWTGIILGVVTFVLGWNITEINLEYVFTRADNMTNMTERLFRPQWNILPGLIEKLIETIFLALMSTIFAIPIAVILSFFAARNLMYRITSTWGKLLGMFLLGIGGAWLGMKLGTWMFLPFVNTNLYTDLLTGIMTPILLLAGLIGGITLGGKLMQRVHDAHNQGLEKVVNGIMCTVLGVGAAYVLSALVSAVAFAASWDIFVRDFGIWPYVVLVAGAVGGAAFSFSRKFESEFPVGRMIYSVIRFILNVIRSIEAFVWALIFVTWFRLGPFPGMVALMVHSIAALAKLYSEQIEGIEEGPLEAVRATGANDLQTIVYAVIPQIIPPYISFTIYRWDINVRMSTIIGLVGGGGIGQMLFQFQNLGQWRKVSVAVILIVAVVMILDNVSARIRERIV